MAITRHKFFWISFKNNPYNDLKKTIIEQTFKINSCFKKDNDKFYYKNLKGEFTPFIFDEKELNFSNDEHIFSIFILKTIKRCMKCLSFLYKFEQIQYRPDINDGFLIKQIDLWLNYLYYKLWLNPIDISCYISFKILTHHYFTNGNKRTSIFFLIEMLEYLHLFLSYSNISINQTHFENRWYTLFVDYAKKHERKNCDYDCLYNDFKNSILNGIFLDIRSIKK